VLAVATFASVRSGNRSARTADRAARIGERSLLHMYVGIQRERTHPPVAEFTSQSRDIYVAPGDNGFWQGAFRDPSAGRFKAAAAAFGAGDPLTLSLLYGDFEGGQRVISQFTLRRGQDDSWLASAVRHFNVDRPDPR
jgi:hypothetical protein